MNKDNKYIFQSLNDYREFHNSIDKFVRRLAELKPEKWGELEGKTSDEKARSIEANLISEYFGEDCSPLPQVFYPNRTK